MRLIDADALKDKCYITVNGTTIGRNNYVMFHEIDEAPTIEPTEHDGCVNCHYEDLREDEYPCNICKESHESKWKMRKEDEPKHSEEYQNGYSKGYDDGLAVGRKEARTDAVSNIIKPNTTTFVYDYMTGKERTTEPSDLISRAEEKILQHGASMSEPMGEWKVYDIIDIHGRCTGKKELICSNCKNKETYVFGGRLPQFCPNCGCKMKNGE